MCEIIFFGLENKYTAYILPTINACYNVNIFWRVQVIMMVTVLKVGGNRTSGNTRGELMQAAQRDENCEGSNGCEWRSALTHWP